MRLAIVGAGEMGATHAGAYARFGKKEHVEIAAIVSRSATRARVREPRQATGRCGATPLSALLVSQTTSAVPDLRRTNRRVFDSRLRRRELDPGPAEVGRGARRTGLKRRDGARPGRRGLSRRDRLHRGIYNDAAGISVHDGAAGAM